MIGMEELMRVFSHYDADGDGRIDRGEFKRLMATLRAKVPDQELDVAFAAIDENGNGTIDFEEFKGWWIERYR